MKYEEIKQNYEVVIGIEVHVQLNTKTKIFCSSPNGVCEHPNTNICPVCAGYPGVLPVVNAEVINCAIMAGLATHSSITPLNEFARKHYFYPDLPKGYQISQFDKPICTEGYVNIQTEDGTQKKVRLIRIHMEEDAGKNLHASQSAESFVDLNRAGTPLLEIVSYPDISSSFEAKAYLKALRNIVTYLGICSGNMEEGAFRADTNVSVRKKGETKLGTRCELKNINSFKFIGDAVEYEVMRQIEIIENGGTITQETRSWDTKEHKTNTLRSKEESADYRYFPDPDLPLISITPEMIEAVKKTMPELPDERLERLISRYKLTPYEADILINDPALCRYYEDAAKIFHSASLINWVLRDVITALKDTKHTLETLPVTPAHCAGLVALIEKGTINNRSAQEVFALMMQTGEQPEVLVKKHNLEQLDSAEELEKIIKEIIAAHPTQQAEYKAGKDKLYGFFVGLVMQKTKGKANPAAINELLKKLL